LRLLCRIFFPAKQLPPLPTRLPFGTPKALGANLGTLNFIHSVAEQITNQDDKDAVLED